MVMKTVQQYVMVCLTCCVMIHLSGCVNMATTGASAVYNRHTIQKNINDQWITMQVYHTMRYKTDAFKNANIAITTFNNELLLAGQAPEEWQKSKAEEIARRVSGLKKIHNFIDIGSPSSTLTRVSDSWITTKVKSRLIASDDVDATQVKVVTENGTVYLMGTISPAAARTAVDIAKNTSGVKKVIKVFSYIHINDDDSLT